jgi:upstream activation factor subunit UAF30
MSLYPLHRRCPLTSCPWWTRDWPPHQKAIDIAIAKRFDAVLAEQNAVLAEQEAGSRTPSSSSDAAPTPTSSSDAIAHSVKAEDDAPVRPPKPKKLKTSVDEDARLAAELHAQWNSGRPSRATKKGAAGGTAAAKKRGKKSEELVHSDGEEEGGDAAGKTKKRKRKVNPNSPFNMPMVLSEPLAGFLGESQVRDFMRALAVWLDPVDGGADVCVVCVVVAPRDG